MFVYTRCTSYNTSTYLWPIPARIRVIFYCETLRLLSDQRYYDLHFEFALYARGWVLHQTFPHQTYSPRCLGLYYLILERGRNRKVSLKIIISLRTLRQLVIPKFGISKPSAWKSEWLRGGLRGQFDFKRTGFTKILIHPRVPHIPINILRRTTSSSLRHQFLHSHILHMRFKN